MGNSFVLHPFPQPHDHEPQSPRHARRSRRHYPTVEGVRSVLRLLGLTNEKIRRLKAEDLADDRFVSKVEGQA